MERIARAKEAMLRQIKDCFGGDRSLAQQVEALSISSEEAIAILADPASAKKKPTADHFAALEAVVTFDGTRPSFLVKNNRIDYSSSFNTANWKQDLAKFDDRLAVLTACVGRVERDDQQIGTAFLVTPTLVITNRHVAQAIAKFDNDRIRVASAIFVNFGREEWNGRASFDRRKVSSVAFAGKDLITAPIVHQKLDLAVLRVSASTIAGDKRQSPLAIGGTTSEQFDFAKYVVAVGYPAKPVGFVPTALQSQFEKVLARLLEGDGGSKRLAPGVPEGVLDYGAPPHWTALHDATTINGNSGSPLIVLRRNENAQAFAAAGLHYGGDWGGGRVNWAHLLSMTGGSVGYGGQQTFAEFCKAEGIAN
jgi:V8-like Glu-specific endopeptidase